MEIKEIQNLIKFVAKSGAHEVKLETDDFKITIKTSVDNPFVDPHTVVQSVPSMVVQTPQVAPAIVDTELPEKPSTEAPKDEADNLITIKSPMIGTFYRKPSPDKDPFIKVGDEVQEGDILCIIEAMKMMNEIKSDFSGKVVSIEVEDGQPVEYGQHIITIN